jgi:asparagine synthetase B (glutamine-hydrolysing)
MLRPDACEFLDGAGGLLDEPNGDSSCAAVYQLARLARGHITVALSGDGGDEMFLGYNRYFRFFSHRSDLRMPGEKRMSIGERYLNRIRVGSDPMLRGLFGDVPNVASSIFKIRSEAIDHSKEPLACTLRQNDVETYLPGAVLAKVDRMSMQHSLEVRTPFLSIELARFCERLPPYGLYNDSRGKVILREVVKRYLPESIVGGSKRGFGLPLTVWGQQELLRSARVALGSHESKLRKLFGARSMDEFLAIQRNGERGLFYYQLWEMMILESWLSHRGLDLPPL